MIPERISILITLFTIFYNDVVNSDKSIEDSVLRRSRRQLLFPNSTLFQFNAGIGTPTGNKMININWAFQANFQLPWNRSQIPVDVLEANSGYVGMSRKKRDDNSIYGELERDGDYENDAKLYHFYKYVEEILAGLGHNGSSCVLKTLCQLGAEPLHSDDKEDLLHELASFVLNPTNDADHGVTEKDDQYHYIRAYHRGHNGEDCAIFYNDCKVSVIDMFTKLHDTI